MVHQTHQKKKGKKIVCGSTKFFESHATWRNYVEMAFVDSPYYPFKTGLYKGWEMKGMPKRGKE